CFSSLSISVYFVFFFQAEDGIRDRNVTGVQTCALPIFIAQQHREGLLAHVVLALEDRVAQAQRVALAHEVDVRQLRGLADQVERSEERRVGKEWRSRWAP